MSSPMSRAGLLFGLAVLAVSGTVRAQDGGAVQPVDLELVLAIDASASITGGGIEFQLRGHAAAFRDRRLAQALSVGPHGAIAVTLVQWSGPGTTEVLVHWTRIATPAESRAFAERIARAGRPTREGSTAIGSALEMIRPMFDANGFEAPQRTVDIVSNGFSNSGIPVETARDRAVAAGITINALAILDEYEWLEDYYDQSVIGGPGAFVRTAEGQESFAEAIRQKLIDEIVQAPPIAKEGRVVASVAADPGN